MVSRMPSPQIILQQVLAEYKDTDKWDGQPFEHIKRISNTKVGDVGQTFVERLCTEIGFDIAVPRDPRGKRLRQHPWDIQIEGASFEVKTATEDVNRSFQFNHIRYHREYDALLCIGISPDAIRMGAWTKAEVTTNKAGHLVNMDKGTAATHKLTKRPEQLHSINEFEDQILRLLTTLNA